MDKEHLNLLCSVNELSSLLAGSHDVDTFLDRVCQMVMDHIRADVCSIYLLDENSNELYMKANKGLNVTTVGMIRMGASEGLVGACLASRRPVCEGKASTNPNYKSFTGLNEEEFEAFLAVPIQRGLERIGVLVLQRREQDTFDEHDVLALQATASQLASAIENARILLALRAQDDTPDAVASVEMQLIKGQVASPGFAFHRSVRIERAADDWLYIPGNVSRTFDVEDFRQALAETEQQLEELESKLEVKLPEMASMIFSAHMMMLKDPEFTGAMEELIAQGSCASQAIRSIALKYVDIFHRSPNAYIREKTSDVKDLARRLMGNLMRTVVDACIACEGRIIIAHDLYPSDLLKLSNENVGGIILGNGGVTSHIAILARSMKIPMVISADARLSKIEYDTPILIDAEIGNIFIYPTPQVIKEFEERNQRRELVQEAEVLDETRTICGEKVQIMGNINLLSDLTQANQLKVEGVGLYRTEFPFLIRTDFPSESDQITIYHHLLESMEDRPVTFRTLDVGGDKALSYFHDMHMEENPVMGMRSIRFSLEFPDIFKEQIRAILCAASGHSHTRLMFPMITGIEEFIRARALVDETLAEMKADNVPHLARPQIGMMVEVPSVIPLIDDLAEMADFFCIGTNDFTQFMLAVDRNNEKVQSYFVPNHPCILRALNTIASAALSHGTDLSICGEMAHNLKHVPFLLGIGIRTLSVDSQYLPALQNGIGQISVADCEAHAAALLKEPTIDAINTFQSEFMAALKP
ncbi:phosphoenolpyruvate--protein phosphotransferase [bacterium M21]|nr:phosphoenolpyruvate--protein phosphotransferase [bacterium M21]